MASFCSKCGAEVSPDTRFCGGCGAPTGVVASPVAAAGSTPVSVAKSSGGLKLVLIIVAVLGLFAVMSAAAVMFGLWRVSKSVKVDRNGEVTISTPAGNISAGKTAEHVTESEAGAPIYPGANSAEGGMKVGGASGSMSTYAFTTGDSVQQVLAFYRDRLGPKATVIETPQGAMVSVVRNDNDATMVTIGRAENEDKTSITITRTISTKQNR